MEELGYHIKNGSITNYVDAEMFRKVYKPAGWVIDPDFHEVPKDEQKAIVEKKAVASEVKNYHAMTKSKSTKRTFNDKIIKGK